MLTKGKPDSDNAATADDTAAIWQLNRLTGLMHARQSALSQKGWLDRVNTLNAALTGDPSFVFGKSLAKAVSNPALAQLVDLGYFNLRGKPKAGKEAFDVNFVKSMVKHGFTHGATCRTELAPVVLRPIGELDQAVFTLTPISHPDLPRSATPRRSPAPSAWSTSVASSTEPDGGLGLDARDSRYPGPPALRRLDERVPHHHHHTTMYEQLWATAVLLVSLAVAFAGVFGTVQPMVFGSTDAPALPLPPTLVAVFTYTALVLVLGPYIPPLLVQWYQRAARFIG